MRNVVSGGAAASIRGRASARRRDRRAREEGTTLTRLLLNLLTSLSLLLSMALATLWARSYRASDSIIWYTSRWIDDARWRGTQYLVTSVKGTLVFGHQTSDSDLSSESASDVADIRRQMPEGSRLSHLEYRGTPDLPYSAVTERVNRFGFGVERRSGTVPTGQIEWRAVKLPAYLPLALFATAPAIWFHRLQTRRSRNKRGFCTRCGYDLRASPGQCPECGTITPARPAT